MAPDVTQNRAWETNHEDDADDIPARAPLTREEASALVAEQPSASPWVVVLAQVVAGVLSAVAWGLLAQRGMQAAGSALMAAAIVALPTALMVRGMGRLPASQPQARVAGFAFWELVKIGLSVALLVGAAVAFRWLHWPALLITLVVCTKMNWLALLWRGRKRTTVVE
ncbi:MAG: putative synthase protein AtpI [Rhizobacter sp.]|nr:putative synthase protein AtpI [Rhizobacter sp.]